VLGIESNETGEFMYNYDYRYEDCEPDGYTCDRCEKYENNIFDSVESLKKVLCQLYDKSPLCLFQFESDLEDLCHSLGEKIPPGQLQIQRAWRKNNY